MILSDFHIHSTFSDGDFTIPQLVDLYGQHGFGAIAITDHLCEEKGMRGFGARYSGRTLTRSTFPLYQEILRSEAERAWQVYRMILIPGIELTKISLVYHKAAHVVALGVTEWISADLDLFSMAKEIRHKGGVSVAAHPIEPKTLMGDRSYYLWTAREELRDLYDAWEITNGPVLLREVLKTDLPKLATSDLHSMRQFSSWKTVFDCERHPQAILDAIRKQELSFRFFETDQKDAWRIPSLRDLNFGLGVPSMGNLATS